MTTRTFTLALFSTFAVLAASAPASAVPPHGGNIAGQCYKTVCVDRARTCNGGFLGTKLWCVPALKCVKQVTRIVKCR